MAGPGADGYRRHKERFQTGPGGYVRNAYEVTSRRLPSSGVPHSSSRARGAQCSIEGVQP